MQRDTGPLTQQDIDMLYAILSKEEPLPPIERATLNRQRFGPRFGIVYTSHGGYNVLYQSDTDKPFLLNLDIAAMVKTECLDRYRQQILDIQRELQLRGVDGVDIIPVGITALFRGPSGNRVITDSIKLVHRQDLEAVFTLTVGDETRYYLSGYDRQEDPPLYFLCRLPHPVATVDEAREALKPESVRVAEKNGNTVHRQGDLFFIQSDMTDEDIDRCGERIDVSASGPVPKCKLYGTIHTATHIARLNNGMEMAKGTAMHRPELSDDGRERDHGDRELGDGWWFVVPNTVPKANGAPRPGRRW